MSYREVTVIETKEILRLWLRDDMGERKIAEHAGVDRKTVRRYVKAAEAAGLVRDGSQGQLTDELLGVVSRRCARSGRRAGAARGRRVRPSRSASRAGSRRILR